VKARAIWLLRQVHAWTGAIVGIAMATITASGTLLLAEPQIRAWQMPEAVATAPPSPARLAEEAPAIIATYAPRQVATLRTPQESFGAWRVYFDDGGGAFVQSGTLAELRRWDSPAGDGLALLYEIHAHALVGETGEQVVGALGLVLALFAMTGLLVWAGQGARLPRQVVVPAGTRRPHLLAWHRDMGVVFSGLVALSGVTGFAMVFESDLVSALEGKTAPAAKPALTQVRPGWTGAVEGLSMAMPGARLQLILLPASPADPVGFRLRQPVEWHPNGRTDHWIDLASGKVVGGRDISRASPIRQGLAAMFPLHAGIAGQVWWTFALAFAGLAATGLALGGLWTFWTKRN
jgi:uncharacterized iron-regulated membrane protein